MNTLIAAITNPALPAGLQNASNPVAAGNILAKYIAVLWQTAIILGGLAVVIYLLMGGFYWITASGEKGKVEEAKERMQQAIIGFVVLSSIAAVSVFLSTAFGIDLLKPQFTNLLGGGGGGGGGQTSDCAGNIPLGGTGNDGGVGGYCTNGGSAIMKCVGPDNNLNYIHLEPCRCSTAPKAGVTLVGC